MEDIKKTVGFCSMERFDNRVFNSVGSSRIRVRWLINEWPEAEEFLIGKDYEVLIFQKVYWKQMMQQFKGIKILDLCDPDWLEGKPVLEYVDMADATTTSTQALADYIKKLRPNARVLCIPDRIYKPDHQPVKKDFIGDAKSAVWFGYSQNIHYIYKTFDELIRRKLSLTVVCESPFTAPVGYSNLQVYNVPFTFPGVNREIIKHDLVLFPDVSTQDERGKFKSNNKTLQAWACGMPVARTPDDLERFMNPEERKKESELRLKEIDEKWDVKISVQEYKDLIEEIKKEKGIK